MREDERSMIEIIRDENRMGNEKRDNRKSG